MKLVYSRRALADLAGIATYYSINASQAIAQSIEHRFGEVIARIQHAPESAPHVEQRAGIRVASVIRYPFRIFYRVRRDEWKFCTFGIRQDDQLFLGNAPVVDHLYPFLTGRV